MKRLFVYLVAVIVVLSLAAAGCTQAAPAPAPTSPPAAPKAAEATKAPAAPTKAPEATKAPVPTTAPTAAPAAAPAKKVEWPEKGKTATIIVPYAAGGSIDVGARLIAPLLEKELGIPFQVVNKAGASTQVGATDLAKSKPDGYTLLYTSDASILVYLDPDRQSAYGRKDLLPLALLSEDPESVFSKGNGPYKTLKDLIDAAKAKPSQVKLGTSGALGPSHLPGLLLQKLAGVKFAFVHFNSAAEAATATIGDHTDGLIMSVASVAGQYKSGAIRALGVMSQKQSLYPEIPTLEEQGYKLNYGVPRVIVAPAGLPKEIADILIGAIRKSAETPDYKKKMEEALFPLRYMDGAAVGKYWDDQEAMLKPLLEEGKKEAATK